MSQGKSAVTLELLDDISDEQIHEAEAYAALYALGGYTYNNVMHEVPDEQCNAAKDNKLETDTYGEDKEGIHEMDRVHPWRISTGSLELPPRKTKQYGCTWSISKFYAARPCNIVSGFRVVLDPSGLNPPSIGPNPERVHQLSQIQPPTTAKGIRSFLGFIAYLGKFCPTM